MRTSSQASELRQSETTTHLLTHLLTGVKCRATSVAKKQLKTPCILLYISVEQLSRPSLIRDNYPNENKVMPSKNCCTKSCCCQYNSLIMFFYFRFLSGFGKELPLSVQQYSYFVNQCFGPSTTMDPCRFVWRLGLA